MPDLNRLSFVRRLLCLLVGTAAFAGAAPAIAAACTIQTAGASQPFAQYGDHADYTLAPGGSFTTGALGWTLDGAGVRGDDGVFAASLSISPGGAAISAPFCVSSETPTMRFYARRTSGGWAGLDVVILWTNAAGQSEATPSGRQPVPAGWAPSETYGLGDLLPTQGGSTFAVRIEFVPASSGGGVAVTDLYVDPYSRSVASAGVDPS